MSAFLLVALLSCQLVFGANPQFQKTSDEEAGFTPMHHSFTGFGRTTDFFVIGLQKCSTTSLFDLFVTKHPDFCRSSEKEPHYFDNPNKWAKGSKHYEGNFKNIACNKKQDNAGKSVHYLDATPDYFYNRIVPSRIFKSFPESERSKKKFILVMREPVEREFSLYNHHARFCLKALHLHVLRHPSTAKDVESGIALWNVTNMGAQEKHCHPLTSQGTTGNARLNYEVDAIANFTAYWLDGHIKPENGEYVEHLENWLTWFDRRQFFIINMATLLSNTTDTVERMARFLGIAPFPNSSYVNGKIVLPHDNGAGNIGTKFDCAVRNALYPHYEPYNQRLYKILKDRSLANVTHEPDFPQFSPRLCLPGQLY
jgi:hypothetical protein